MRLAITCEQCKTRYEVAREILTPQQVTVWCGECEQHISSDITEDDLQRRSPVKLAGRGLV